MTRLKFSDCKNTFRLVLLFLFTSVIMLSSATLVQAQAWKKFTKKPDVKFSGALNLQYANYVSNQRTSLPKSSFRITGNPRLSIYGINIPISLIYSDQNVNYRQSLNRFGISPEYKWAKVHIGYRNLNYSKYTLAGHTMFGGGIELTPGNWQLGLSHGRLNKANKLDTTTQIFQPISFSRKMSAAEVKYVKQGGEVGVSIMKAWDDPESVKLDEQFGVYNVDTGANQEIIGQSASNVRPGENLAVSMQFKTPTFKGLIKGFKLEADAGASYYTEDLNVNISKEEDDILKSKGIPTVVGNFLDANLSTDVYYAMDVKLKYSLSRKMTTYVSYKRIEPDYRSMGAYFFNNDIEHAVLGMRFTLLKNSLRFNGSFGKQRNNLNNIKTSTSNRGIGNLNIGYTKGKFGVNFNFNSYDFDQTPQISSIGGSLKVTQTSRRLMISPRYNWGDTSKSHSINLSFSDNLMQNFTGESFSAANSREINTRVSAINFSGSIFRKKWSYYVSPNMTQVYSADTLQYSALGLSAGSQKSFLKDKLRANGSFGAFSTKIFNQTSVTYNGQLNLSYEIYKGMRVGANIMYNNSPNQDKLIKNEELRSILNLSYRF